MRETGLVLRIEGDRAIVEMDFKGGCKSCAAAGGCTAKGPGKRELNLPVGESGVEAGQWIEIETRPRSLMTAALMVFILPLVIAVGGYFLAASLGAGEGMGLLVFFAAFAVAEGIIALLDRWIGRHRFFEPEIVKAL